MAHDRTSVTKRTWGWEGFFDKPPLVATAVGRETTFDASVAPEAMWGWWGAESPCAAG